MPEETTVTPSASESVTPTPALPVTGTSASTAATAEPKPTLTHEDVLKRLANAEDELERHRKNAKKLADYEKADKARQEAEQAARDAALSEVEKANKRAQEAEARNKEIQQKLAASEVKIAAKDMGFHNPARVASLIKDELEYDEDGMPSNLDKVLNALAKSDPYLLADKTEPAPESPAQTASKVRTPAVPPMNPPGRSSIPTPPATTPGQRPDWNTAFKRPGQY